MLPSQEYKKTEAAEKGRSKQMGKRIKEQKQRAVRETSSRRHLEDMLRRGAWRAQAQQARRREAEATQREAATREDLESKAAHAEMERASAEAAGLFRGNAWRLQARAAKEKAEETCMDMQEAARTHEAALAASRQELLALRAREKEAREDVKRAREEQAEAEAAHKRTAAEIKKKLREAQDTAAQMRAEKEAEIGRASCRERV